jgi:type I restriction enzyme S subunit
MSSTVIASEARQSSWRECKLGEVAKLSKKSWKVGDEQMPYIGLEHIEEAKLRLNDIGSSDDVASNKFRFQAGDTLFGKLRPYFRKVVKPSFDGICSTDIWVINPQKGIDKNFIFYFFANKELVDISYSASGGTRMPRADWDFLAQTIWNIPPLEEQKRIAEVLSSLDDKIDLLHRQNQTLESLAQTLFRQWFIEEAKESKMGKFSDWIEDTIGGDWGKENPTDDFNVAVYCIRGTDIADLNNGLPTRTPLRYIKQKKLESIKPKEGDIILEISGGTEDQSTGRTTYINQQIRDFFKHPIVFSNFCRLIRIKKNEYSFFVYLYLQYLYENDEFFGLENGSSGIKNLNYKVLINDLEYQMPSKNEVIKFHNNAKSYFEKINQNKKQIQTLENLRDMLLPKLLSGEARVKI